MKNNILLLIIIGILTTLTSFQTTPTTDSETYHVMATSGLRMRKTPELKGEKLLTIPYNGKVEKINDGKSYGELTIQELKDFFIKGEWVKVKYNGQEGFVFSGYLTQFPLPDKNIKEVFPRYTSKFEHYFDKNFTQKGKRYNIFRETWKCKTEEECVCGYSLDYEEGIFYSNWACDEKNGIYNVEIDNISMLEAYFFVKILDINDDGGKNTRMTYDKRDRTIRNWGAPPGCGVLIKKRKRNSIKIEMTCGC